MLKVPFSPPDITDEEIKEVVEALRSGWITTGPRTKELEKNIADFCGGTSKKVVCLNSQTACAEMALRLLGVGEGDEVIVPAYTYTATASVVCHVGAKLVMVDTVADGYTMDYDKLEQAITPATKVIIPVDLGGIPCDYKRIFEIVEKKKGLFKPASRLQKAMGRISVNADTAHAFGAFLGDRPVGCIADFSAFSFHAVKNFTTAEGGALTWNTIPGIDDEELYRELQFLSLHGQSKDALAKTKMGSWEYDIVAPFYKCNMTDVAAGIGLAQLKRYPQMLQRRREIIERYDAAFRPFGLQTLEHYTDEYQSSGHLYLTRVPGISLEERNEIITEMAKRGVACNVHYKPLPMHSAYKNMGFNIKDFPNAYAQFENEISLPLHTCLTDEQVEYVINSYCEVLKEKKIESDDFYMKNHAKIVLATPTMHGDEMKFINQAFEKNWIAPLGFNCDGFEKEMRQYQEAEVYPLAVSSGTAALHLSVKLAGIKPGDVVLCSDMTFAATVNPVVYEGGVPVFIDSEYETWNLDPQVLEKAFAKYPQAKAVMMVHLYGVPAKMDEIRNICKKHQAILIEDAAEALSSSYKGEKCGTFGKYSVLSFNGNKIITTSGGGMLLCKDAKTRERALFLATQAKEPFPYYQHEEIGYNYRLSNVLAGIGRGQLIHVEEHKRLKEKIYHRYEEGLRDLPVTMNPYLNDSKPNFWLSCMTINEGVDVKPEYVMQKLAEVNIESRPIWKPMHMQPVFSKCDYISLGEKNVCEDIFARGLCLPSDIKMTEEQQDFVIANIKKCF